MINLDRNPRVSEWIDLNTLFSSRKTQCYLHKIIVYVLTIFMKSKIIILTIKLLTITLILKIIILLTNNLQIARIIILPITISIYLITILRVITKTIILCSLCRRHNSWNNLSKVKLIWTEFFKGIFNMDLLKS